VAVYCILMDRQYSIYRYTTRIVEDNKEGSSALELHQTSDKDGSTKRVARVVVWDAFPDFFIETFGSQIPAVVAEQLLAEARSTIKIR
jgi:hypothetical protein